MTMRIRKSALVLAGFLLFLAWTFAGVGGLFYADSHCLRHGYPQSSLTFTFHAYCIKRVNQTDVVVPLDSLER